MKIQYSLKWEYLSEVKLLKSKLGIDQNGSVSGVTLLCPCDRKEPPKELLDSSLNNLY